MRQPGKGSHGQGKEQKWKLRPTRPKTRGRCSEPPKRYRPNSIRYHDAIEELEYEEAIEWDRRRMR